MTFRRTQCHTLWAESCWQAFRPCPYADCKGELRVFSAPKAPSRPKPGPKEYPLLDA